MRNAKINQHALNEMFQNAHIAMQSISNLSPEVEDSDMKEEILFEYDEYQKFIGELSRYMEENGLKREDVGVMKKAMLWGSIKMKTLMNSSRNQVAEMMINGTVMGINELTAMKNESSVLDNEVKSYVEKLLELEENYNERLKKFL
jgi:hypothetical protein